MKKAKKKTLEALEKADEALAAALFDLIEMQADCNSKEVRENAAENVWREICHARKLMAMVFDED